MDLANKRITVMGLGSFGGQIAAIRFLAEQNAREIIVTDSKPAEQLADSLADIADLPNVTLRLGGHIEADFVDVDAVVASPAVPRSAALLAVARAAGVVVTSEMNLFMERCRGRIVGVTGSAGKSTTTAMIEAVLARGRGRQFGQLHVGGNIGHRPLLGRVDQIACDDLVVLELSSFQLADLACLQRSPHVAVVTNIAPNHLDWHGSMAAYIHSKQNILRFQQPDDVAILNGEDPALTGDPKAGSAGWQSVTPARTAWYRAEDVADLSLKVVGRHNRSNAAAALAVARQIGIDQADIVNALSEFAGLPHRLELLAAIDGVRWFNDSKSTTPESTQTAIDAFAQTGEPLIVIVGGYDKKIDLAGLCEQLAGRAKAVVTIGQTGPVFAALVRSLRIRGSDGGIVQAAGDLPAAVRAAAAFASPGDVVLLSPASASYDQFANYEQRGQRFGELVAGLAAGAM